MIERFFHAWERRIAAATTNRVVRPFDWGLDWMEHPGGSSGDPARRMEARAAAALSDPAWFASTPCPGYVLGNGRLTFPSQIETPHPANNTVHARYFPAASEDRRRAVLVLPRWNADAEGHAGLCRFLARVGISALRLSLPYHDARMPPELERADYIVSANIGRTLRVNRQAVLDARRAIAWLDAQGHDRIGILGTSLGSCLALLTAAHEPRVTAAALNHVSPYFADVVWDGLSTAHVRAGLDGAIDLDRLRRLWLPISPYPYIERLRETRVLLVYALYDLSFPVHLSRRLVAEFHRRGLTPQVFALPCGHYTTGEAPFKWLDGYVLIQFLRRNL